MLKINAFTTDCKVKKRTWIISINLIKNFVVSQWGLLFIEYHVFLRPGGQDEPASQRSSRSFENLIATEVENH